MPTDFRGTERERERHQYEKHLSAIPYMCPDQGPKPQPRHVSQLGIEPATFLWFMDNAPIN